VPTRRPGPGAPACISGPVGQRGGWVRVGGCVCVGGSRRACAFLEESQRPRVIRARGCLRASVQQEGQRGGGGGLELG
jgi:hypothetical protein